MNRGEPIAELVGDSRGQLADLRETFLQSQLLLHLHDGRQVREQANHAVGRAAAVRKRRDADAEICR